MSKKMCKLRKRAHNRIRMWGAVQIAALCGITLIIVIATFVDMDPNGAFLLPAMTILAWLFLKARQMHHAWESRACILDMLLSVAEPKRLLEKNPVYVD